MKNIKVISIAALAALMSLSACAGGIFNSSNQGNTSVFESSMNSDESKNDSSEVSSKGDTSSSIINSSSQGGNTSSSSIPDDDDEEYTISVSQTTGVTVTLSKNKAKKGETITITLKVESGYTVKEVTASNTSVTKVSDTKYTFVMPNRSVRVTISVDVEGDVALVGEIAAAFVKDASTNKYVAKDVKVESKKASVGFDVVIKDKSGNPTKLKAIDFDEARSFGNVQGAYGSSYTFTVASGSTYDFYYEPECEFPFSVVRTRVDVVPTDADGIYSLFEGRMRSSPACHPTNLVGIKYSYESNSLKYDYDYKLYQNNVSFGKVVDKTDAENPQNYYIYKNADLKNNLYTVVNTWTKAKGNNENADYTWNLDPNKDDDTSYYQAYAGKFDITATDTDTPRREISVRDAVRNVEASAHYGAELEYEFYDTYRSVYSGNVVINAPANYNLDLKSTKNDDGTFDVSISSWTEYNYDATANTADVTAHEGNVYTNNLHFLANGALQKVDCTKVYYAQKEWNFTTHKPIGGGTTTHFVCENTFGSPASGSPDFDVTPYFISKINSAAWYNSLTNQAKSTSESHVNYGDVLELVPYGNAGKKASNCNSFSFEPATALDAWQYTISSVEDATKIALNGQRKWACVGTGSTNVTISNNISNATSATYKTKVNIYASGTVHGFFINCTIPGYDSYQCENSTILEAYAGKTTTYYVDTSVNTGCPCEYEIYFQTKDEWGDSYSKESPYVNVVQTGTVLILDCNTEASLALTATKELTVKIRSQYYLTNWGPSTWTIRVNTKPMDSSDIINSQWIMHWIDSDTKQQLKDYVTVDFTDTLYESADGYYKGVVTSYAYDGDTLAYTTKWYFAYHVTVSCKINASLTGFESNDPEWKDEPYYYFGLEFGGISNGLLAVALWYFDYETTYADILGYIAIDDEDGNYYAVVESYYGFEKVTK